MRVKGAASVSDAMSWRNGEEPAVSWRTQPIGCLGASKIRN